MHLVRKTIAVDYAAFEKTVGGKDPELWQEIDASRARLEQKSDSGFDRDGYAAGFAEAVADVWDQIRDEVLKERW